MDYYRMDADEALEKLNSTKDGLQQKEADKRQLKYGKNIVQIDKEVSFFMLLLKQFKSYLVWLLVFLSAFALITGIYFNREDQLINSAIIGLIVVINAFVGAYQDYKSEKTAQLLKSMLKNQAIVVRSGKNVKIDAQELVPGDVVILEEGGKVPADCRILESSELKIDESQLTGESEHVGKNTKTLDKAVPLAERKCMVYMNSYVTSGEAKCLVVQTGKSTEVGKIAESLEEEHESLFLAEVDEASKKITFAALGIIIIAITVFYLKAGDWLGAFMMGSALIIGSIPEGLPAVVTFTLSIASSKLARNNVLVKRKTVLETLGSVDVICTDKTGTLTENRMAIKKVYINDTIIDEVSKITKQDYSAFRNCGLLCNEAKDTEKGFMGEAEDIALIDFFNDAGEVITKVKKEYPMIKFEPFSSENKYAASINKVGNKTIRYLKGAPEVVIDQCTHILINGKEKRFGEEEKKKLEKIIEGFSEEALRNIAYSYKENGSRNIVFIGVTGMYDAPKEGIKKTIETIYKANIDVKMITGDNPKTAMAIAKECGFRNVKAATWDDLKDLSNEQLKQKVIECNIFARMSPEFKVKIVTALQEMGKRVGITGDGVNDVPALKRAEIGIAMGKRGTDIAKEAAELILLDDNLSSVVRGIKTGRTIFSNIRKVINYLLTANLAEVAVVFMGSMLGLLPFLPIQLLWVNFVTDIAPAMALGMDPSHKDIMTKKPTGKDEKLINKRITYLTVGVGIQKAIVAFGVFLVVFWYSHNLILAQTLSFTWLVFSHIIRIVSIRFDEKMPVFINKYLNAALFFPVLVQVIIIYTPLSHFFHVIALTIPEWIVLVVSVGIGLALAKFVTYIIDMHVAWTDRDY